MPNLRNLRSARKSVLAGVAVAGMAAAVVSQTGVANADDVAPAGNTQLALRSTGNQLFVLAPGQSSYRSLGGSLTGAPVDVQVTGNQHLFIAAGSNKQLYVRRATGTAPTTGWSRLVPSSQNPCTQPDAKLFGTTLIVGCRSAQGDLRYGTATVTATSGNPVLNSLTSLGGQLDSGPAVYSTGPAGVAPAANELHFLVETNGSTFDRSAAAADHYANTGIHGTSQPYVFFQGGNRYTLIRGASGSLHYIAGSRVGDGGKIVGRPTATVNNNGEVQVYVVGTDNHVYTAILSTSGLGGFRRVLGGTTTPSGLSSAVSS